jgi:hypothetical protein
VRDEPQVSAWCKDLSRDRAVFLFYSLVRIPFAVIDGGEPNHSFLDGLAMTLGELQTGNPSEALVLSVGFKCGVRWGPSSYFQALTYIVVDLVRPKLI